MARKGLSVLLGVALWMLLATPAHAVLTIIVNGVNDGTTIAGGIMCADNAGCDTNPGVGIIALNNVPGGILNISTDNSKSNSPSAAISTTLNGTPQSLGTITVAVSDNNSPPRHRRSQ